MQIEPGELMFWIFVVGITSTIGIMLYDFYKHQEKKS